MMKVKFVDVSLCRPFHFANGHEVTPVRCEYVTSFMGYTQTHVYFLLFIEGLGHPIVCPYHDIYLHVRDYPNGNEDVFARTSFINELEL